MKASGLTPEQQARYSRQLVLPEVGEAGQEKLRRARVLIVGAGGLGSPAALYLAAAGVGTLGLVDADRVELSNLQRQVLHATGRIGRPKALSAKEAVEALNPEVRVEPHPLTLSPDNALSLVASYDLVIDAVDNLPSRYVVNDACHSAGKPLIEAGVLRWEGMVTTILPGQSPCYRCLFPVPPPAGAVAGAREAGVMGVAPGVIGVIQAAEALKLILGAGSPLAGRLLLFDALCMSFREVKIERNPDCPLCGTGRR
ncbi:MAG: HesA/MoeB/ThiF family protein [Clostridia bacterium]|nr:HesA/MoeB/ThiF family protein [Clostridia bacterium]MDH7572349.1 HesA/MoeB/ThiF family protein [Clostridia bacterium]